MKIPRRQTLYVQAVTEDSLGYSRNLELPIVSRSSPAKLLAAVGDVDRIMIRGATENAALISNLHLMRESRPLPPIYLCTPQVHGPDLASTFAAMRELNLPGSLGGYHELTERDAPNYSLAIALRISEGRASSVVDAILRSHRAWPALSFVSAIDMTAAARVLGDIVDPRWFINLKNPNSLSRLHSYLGLTPRNMEQALAHRVPDCKQSRRCANVLQAWYRGPHAEFSSTDPGAFLQQVVGDEDEHHKIRGFVKASRMFVAFVRDVWLDRTDLLNRRLFVPKYFFRYPWQALRYERHLAQCESTKKA